MPTTLSASSNPEKKSSLIVTAAFTDPDGNAVTPEDGLKWHLTDETGRVTINDRADVALTEDTSVTIALTGDDLDLFGAGDDGVRRLTVEGTYSFGGAILDLTDYVQFTINDIPAV